MSVPPLTSPTLITLFEHQERSFEELGRNTADPAWEILEEINRTAGKELIRLNRRGIRARDYVGVLQVGNLTIQILPKIANDGDPNTHYTSIPFKKATVSAVHNLLFLLEYAYGLKLNAPDIADLSSFQSSWYELLTRLFASDLHRQIQIGMVHQYISVDDNLQVKRGRWDIQRQMARHAYQQHRFDVSYDEFTHDNELNQVFSFVIRQLASQTCDRHNAILLGDLSAWFGEVTSHSQISAAILDKVYFNRLNDRFEPAFNLARLFISSGSIQLTHGPQSAYAFLLDMDVLFQQFLAGFLQKHKIEIFPTEFHSVFIQSQAEGSRFFLGERFPNREKAFNLKPDLLIRQPGETRPLIILDAKYKLLSPNKQNLGVSDADIYQMLAYSVHLECLQVILIYPQSTIPVRQSFIIPKTKTEIRIQTLNLKQPLSSKQPLIDELRGMIRAVQPSLEV